MRMLLLARLADFEGRSFTSVCGEVVLPVLLANGVEVHQPKGSFMEVRRAA